MTKFVEVPISVNMPPKIERYEMGISNFEALVPVLFEILFVIGIKIDTIGVLFKNADKPVIVTNNLSGLKLVASKLLNFVSWWKYDEFSTAPAIMKRTATANTPLLENPIIASSTVIYPAIRNTVITRINTFNGSYTSLTRRSNITMIVTIVIKTGILYLQ